MNTPAGGVTLPELPEPDFQATERNLGHNAYTAAQMREYARAALAGEWRDASEAPEDVSVLVYGGFTSWIAWRDGEQWRNSHDSTWCDTPTHYRELPAAPLPKEPGR